MKEQETNWFIVISSKLMFTTDYCDIAENKEATTDSVKRRDEDIDFSQQAVLEKLFMLKPDKSAGLDGIHSSLLKSCAAALTEPLSIIIHISFETGEVPSDWKTAIIAPIYKEKGSRMDPSNYRPITLTSVTRTRKMMESLIRDKVTEYVNKSSILTKHPHGFVQQRSCLTNLLETLEAWTEAMAME